MRLEDPRTGLERLDRAECLRLLADDSVGRLVIVRGGAPEIFPVNYAMDGDDVVFRSDEGTKLLGTRAVTCFEIDHVDRATRTGWSVVLFGRLEEISPLDSTAWARVHALAVAPWAGGVKDHWMRIVPNRISGRRLGPRRTARD